jgi:hypothetical protein
MAGRNREQLLVEQPVLARLERAFPDLEVRPRVPLAHPFREFAVDIRIREDETARVCIELKADGISTDQLIVASGKAQLLRQIHPHLRCGLFVAGCSSGGIPRKWLWYGESFHFMLSCRGETPSEPELDRLVEIVEHEVNVSRRLEGWLSQTRKPWPTCWWSRLEIDRGSESEVETVAKPAAVASGCDLGEHLIDRLADICRQQGWLLKRNPTQTYTAFTLIERRGRQGVNAFAVHKHGMNQWCVEIRLPDRPEVLNLAVPKGMMRGNFSVVHGTYHLCVLSSVFDEAALLVWLRAAYDWLLDAGP